jgi:sugar lactone lactonase YvrE
VGQALAFFREKPEALAPRPLPLRRETSAELARELSFPGKIAIDPAGTSLYIADSNHHRIVVTNLEGRFVRAIGGGEEGLKDGPADEARFSHPQGMAFSGRASSSPTPKTTPSGQWTLRGGT